MAHNTNFSLIYAESSDGLNSWEVATALGITTEDWGELCTHENINMWAKCKPFRNSAWGFADATAYEDARVAGNYGISIPGVEGSNLPSLISTAKSAGAPDWLYGAIGLTWSHDEPRGWQRYLEPFRLLDFDGYKPRDKFPLHSLVGVMYGAMKYSIDVYGRAIKTAPNLPVLFDGHLTEDDLTATINRWGGSRYLGIVYRNQSNSSDWDCRTLQPQTQWPYNIVISGLHDGDIYDCAYFVCGKVLNNKGDISASDQFYLAPYPYFTMGDYQAFGLVFQTKNAHRFEEEHSVSFVLQYKCLGVDSRHITDVKVCHRSDAHYERVGTTNRYRITKEISHIAEDDEYDLDLSTGEMIVPITGDIYENFPPNSSGFERLITLPVNPLVGKTFIVFRHRHYSPTTHEWVDDVQGADGNAETQNWTGGGLYAQELTFQFPITPDINI